MTKYKIQKSPFHVPTTDGKTILEHWGNSMGTPGLSIAHMKAPKGWSEPFQTPEFDEYTLIVRGKKRFEIEGEVLDLEEGQSILIQKGARVRYSNPFSRECEYVSICLPAFSLDLVHREET
ncbi:cupin domain-containing protein [Chryseobacterium sp. A301]